MPKISIIIPTFNRCETLKRAVASVFEQTFTDFEVIIVDDGSTDQTPVYCSSIDNPQVICRRFEKNLGGNTARNEGVAHSSGELLAFLDDDDCWLPGKLEKQLEEMRTGAVDLCYTAKNVIYQNATSKRYSYLRPRYKNLHKSIMRDNFIGSTSTIIIKKRVLEEVGGFDPNLPGLQDYDVYIRLIRKGYRIKGLPEPLVDYHVVDEKRSISCSLDDFSRASQYLIEKYHDDPYLHLLKRGLRVITMKRLIKSRHFLLDSVQLLFKRVMRTITKKFSGK